MNDLAKTNGWHGFDGTGERVEGGWEYRCDGMPTLMGCCTVVTVTRRWSRVGVKKSGWLVCYGLEDEDGMTVEDHEKLDALERIVQESAYWGYQLAKSGRPFVQPVIHWDGSTFRIVAGRAS